jgi:hypothetical protein
MKKLFLLILISLLYVSCSTESEAEDVTFELLPVNTIELPTSFKVNKENIIKVKFIRPTDCYAFNKFYNEQDGATRTFVVESTVFENGSCSALASGNNVATQILKFRPEQIGEYTLKFWQGKDMNGDDLFLTYNILVE